MMSSSSMLTKSIADMDNSLNVSDTLEQATKALAAHRAWMQKRTHVHNAVVPAPFSGPPSSEDAAAAATKKPKPLDWAVASSSLPKAPPTSGAAHLERSKLIARNKGTVREKEEERDVNDDDVEKDSAKNLSHFFAAAVTPPHEEDINNDLPNSFPPSSSEGVQKSRARKNPKKGRHSTSRTSLSKVAPETTTHDGCGGDEWGHRPGNQRLVSPDVFVSRGEREGLGVPPKASSGMQAWGSVTAMDSLTEQTPSANREESTDDDSPIKSHLDENKRTGLYYDNDGGSITTVTPRPSTTTTTTTTTTIPTSSHIVHRLDTNSRNSGLNERVTPLDRSPGLLNERVIRLPGPVIPSDRLPGFGLNERVIPPDRLPGLNERVIPPDRLPGLNERVISPDTLPGPSPRQLSFNSSPSSQPYNTSGDYDEDGDESKDHLESLLRETSSSRLVAVSPAPRAQRTSYTSHKQTKLVRADASGRVYDFGMEFEGPEDPISTSSGSHSILGMGSPISNRQKQYQDIPESSVKYVLPKQNGRKLSSTIINSDSSLPLNKPSSSLREGGPTKESELRSKLSVNSDSVDGASLAAATAGVNAESKALKLISPGAAATVGVSTKKEALKLTSPYLPGAAATVGVSTKKEALKLTSPYLPGAAATVGVSTKKEALKLTSPYLPGAAATVGVSTVREAVSPLNLVSPYLSDFSLSGKRSRNPPGYDIHRPAGGLALAPPCPLYGEEQPHEEEEFENHFADSVMTTDHRGLSGSSDNKSNIRTNNKEKEKDVMIVKSISSESLDVVSSGQVQQSVRKGGGGGVGCGGGGGGGGEEELEKNFETPQVSTARLNRMSSTLVLNDTAKVVEVKEKVTEVEAKVPEVNTEVETAGNSNQRDIVTSPSSSLPLPADIASTHSLVIGELPRGPGPLHLAAKSGNLRCLKSLLQSHDQSHDIDMPDHDGRTPLMYCVIAQGVQLSCADALISNGASLNRQSSDGATAMHMAASIGAVSMVELLLMNGANPDARDFEGRLPLHWATLQKGIKTFTVLLKSSRLGLDCTDDQGMTVLMWAAYNNNPSIVSYLIDKGADTEEKDADGCTAMHWSVHRDNSHCLQILLKPDMTYFKDQVGKTVMHLAAEKGSMAACEVILKLRPEAIHDTDRKGHTPLHYAAACSRVDVSALLLDYGADASYTDHASRTPLDYARGKKMDYVVALLSCHGNAVADFVRMSRSTSLSSIFNQKLIGYDQGLKDVSPLQQSSGLGSDDHIPESSSSSSPGFYGGALDLDTTKGGYLGRFFSQDREMVRHYYFRINEEEGSIYWSRSHEVTFRNPRRALVLEVHKGASNTVQNLPQFSPTSLHCYCFWVITSGGVLDLLAYNEDTFILWTTELERLAAKSKLRGPGASVQNFKSDSVHSRPSSSLGMSSLSKSSIVPFDGGRGVGENEIDTHRSSFDSSIFVRKTGQNDVGVKDEQSLTTTKNLSFSKHTKVVPIETQITTVEKSPPPLSERNNFLDNFVGGSGQHLNATKRELQASYHLDVVI